MKVIDLIIAISNREKVPYKIKYDGKEMVYDGNKQDYLGYYSNGNGEWLFQYLFDRCKNTSHFINDYVEVLEDKEIEDTKYMRHHESNGKCYIESKGHKYYVPYDLLLLIDNLAKAVNELKKEGK